MAEKRIVVDLSEQSVTAYEGSTVFRACECVTGNADHPTPKGLFSVNRKSHPYTSRKYKVPMDYALFFTTDGVALHKYHGPAPWWMLRAGRVLTDAVGSRGCVRLQEEDAKALYGWATYSTAVEVVR
jgi:lipoprotein-anchoring transpeptidase ErfK/SrfK